MTPIAPSGLTAEDMERGRYVRISHIRRLFRRRAGWMTSLRWMPTTRRRAVVA